MKSICFIVQSLALMCLCSTSYADMLFSFGQQAGTVIETVGNQRAIYLGRFQFDGPTPSNDFTGIWAGVTIRDANNVRLFLGNGDLTFDGNASMVDSGVVFTQLTNNQPTAVAAPGLPPSMSGLGVAPLALSASVGNALHQLLTSSANSSFPNGYLDGWLVSNNPQLFTAPSSSNPLSSSATPFNAFIGITAVPEPSSIVLIGLLMAGAGGTRLRRRFVAKKSKSVQ